MVSPVFIHFEPDGKRIRAEPGDTVKDASEKAGVGLESECGARVLVVNVVLLYEINPTWARCQRMKLCI